VTAAASVGLLLLCVVIYVVVRDFLRAPRMHALRNRLRLERNRNRFGELRTNVVRLAVTGDLNPKSKIFRGIYSGTTNLMRNPYAMEAAAQAVLMIPAPWPEGGPRPTKAEGDAAREFARRIDLLCRDFSKAYVAAAWIIDRCGITDSGAPLWIQMIQAREQQRIKAMVEARKRLECTAQVAAA